MLLRIITQARRKLVYFNAVLNATLSVWLALPAYAVAID